jgi:hypothetical protein
VLRKNSITAWHTSFVDTLESAGARAPPHSLKAGSMVRGCSRIPPAARRATHHRSPPA